MTLEGSDLTTTPETTRTSRWAAFWLGYRERHLATGMTYDGDPNSPLSVAYDHGRNWGERLHR